MRVIYLHIKIVCMQYDIYGRKRVLPSVSVSVSPSNLGHETRITWPLKGENSFVVLRTELYEYELSEILCILSKTNFIYDLIQIFKKISKCLIQIYLYYLQLNTPHSEFTKEITCQDTGRYKAGPRSLFEQFSSQLIIQYSFISNKIFVF